VSAMFETINADHSLGLAIGALSSVFWTVTYALILRQGARDKTFGMPLVALGANLAWEVVFLSVTLARHAFDARLALILPWTLLDFAIVAQAFRYGRHEFRNPIVVRHFNAVLTCVLVLAGAAVASFVRVFHDAIGWYAAFAQNLMMSVLFVAMLRRRGSLRGQSTGIALSKLLGSFFAFVLAVFWSPPTLHEHWGALMPERYTPIAPAIALLYAGICAFDVLYLALVRRYSASGRVSSVSHVAGSGFDAGSVT
jgi:hypothetical protein